MTRGGDLLRRNLWSSGARQVSVYPPDRGVLRLTRLRARARRRGMAAAWRAGALAIVLTLSSWARAQARDRAPTPVDALGTDIVEAFIGYNVLFYGTAVAETAGMALGGADHRARVFVHKNIAAPAWGDAALQGGYFLPLVIASAVWAAGLASDDPRVLGAGSAVVQALAVTAATTLLLKWSTGRPFPLNGGSPTAPDVLTHPEYARELHPLNWNGNWAWPSGHTSTITAVIAALSSWDPTSVVIPLVGYPLSAAIGLGMIVGDHHWTSDVVAGELVGYAIGSSVGKSFRLRAEGKRSDPSDVRIVPLGVGTIGAAAIGTW